MDSSERPKGEVIQHEAPANDRSLARRIALQILYEVDSAGHNVGNVTAIHLNARQVGRKPSRYVRNLVNGVMQHRPVLDRVIRQFAPEWPVEQMAIVDRNILRMAIYEFGVDGGTPVGAAIDEAVTLARLFGAESTPSFVNGVLGALASDQATLQEIHVGRPDDEDGDEPE
jgi:N utilization substance protein B